MYYKANESERYDLENGTLLDAAQKAEVIEAIAWVKKRNKKKFFSQKIESIAIYHRPGPDKASFFVGHVVTGSGDDVYFKIQQQN